MQVAGNLEAAGSGNYGSEGLGAEDLTEAAAHISVGVQHNVVRGGSASCSTASHQPMQPLSCNQEGSLPVSMLKHSRKRSAANMLLKYAAKRQAGMGLSVEDAAASSRDKLDLTIAEAGSSAAGAAGINAKRTEGLRSAREQRRLLRVRRNMDKVLFGHT